MNPDKWTDYMRYIGKTKPKTKKKKSGGPCHQEASRAEPNSARRLHPPITELGRSLSQSIFEIMIYHCYKPRFGPMIEPW